ncbi:MAG: hypothetical protein JWO81_2191 [Alphaproteobacteria bacterium]|nr:hypothetical protein [Alphaproteobacteria bacterium]
MRCRPLLVPLLLLSLAAARGPGYRHHFMPHVWQSPRSDGMSRRDFGRAFHPYDIRARSGTASRYDIQGLPREQLRLNQLDMGNGAHVGVGFVQGHRPGITFGLSF